MQKQLGIIVFLWILTAFFACSQDSLSNKLVGIGLGTSIPKTDLEPSYKRPGANMSAFLQFTAKKRLNVGMWLNVGEIQAENREVAFLDQSEFQINSYARTAYQSLHVEPTFHLVKKEKFSLYVAQGFGFFRFTVFGADQQNLANQLNSRSPAESFSNFSVVLPTTINAYYMLPNSFGVHFRLGWMNPITDYLDNISNFGNPDDRDNIFTFQLSMVKQLKRTKKEEI